MAHRINLGDIARDEITGFQGVVTARSQWLQGCDRLQLQPRDLDDGSIRDPQWFDEPQVELVSTAAVTWTPEVRETGGPRPDPTSRK